MLLVVHPVDPDKELGCFTDVDGFQLCALCLPFIWPCWLVPVIEGADAGEMQCPLRYCVVLPTRFPTFGEYLSERLWASISVRGPYAHGCFCLSRGGYLANYWGAICFVSDFGMVANMLELFYCVCVYLGRTTSDQEGFGRGGGSLEGFNPEGRGAEPNPIVEAAGSKTSKSPLAAKRFEGQSRGFTRTRKDSSGARIGKGPTLYRGGKRREGWGEEREGTGGDNEGDESDTEIDGAEGRMGAENQEKV
ncbi:hypothetical protein Nepgr_007852 [Nepenthes gracilis]|uniref:Uncharacterized protein n=1 Tax=Nepenthes gracilis TaxID=150966 RepID=A0AAD3XIN1_NEPGR|nr:hypothetical protein Nepgr_007852 [Nepenthes gracilis]